MVSTDTRPSAVQSVVNQALGQALPRGASVVSGVSERIHWRSQVKSSRLVALAALALIAGSSAATAQSATTYAAGNQWGTTSSGVAVNGAVESAVGHNLNGAIAASVNGAQKGLLISNGSGGSLSISSVGSQTIVSSSVVATNSTVSSPINATQTSSNTGDVSTTGTITVK
jgi:hypothetical protein